METKTKLWPNFGGAFTGVAKEGKDAGKAQFYAEITEEMIKTFTEAAQIGGTIVFTFNKTTVKGNDHYFGKLRPPREHGQVTSAPKARKVTTTSALE